MAKGSGQVEETAQEKALSDIGKQQLADYKQRWLPVQQQYAKGVVAAGASDSFQRRSAVAKTGIDTSFRYGQAADKLDSTEAARGAFGSAGHKLALTGLQQDQATSTGLGAVAANQAADDQYASGLGSVTAIGRGEKASAASGIAQSASLSARQASEDADRALTQRMGNFQFAGQVAGLGAGLYAGMNRGNGLTIDPDGYGITSGDSPYSATSADIFGRH